MFENIAAIDVGSYSVKLVKVRTGLRDFQLKSFAYEDIDPEIDDPAEGAKRAIEKLLAEESLKGYRLFTNLPMEKEIIRNITFPFNDVEKIAEAIPYEAEENIPFKLDDLVLDFQSLKSKNESEGRVLLAAAHKDSLYDYLRILDECGLKPIRMGMESNALFECYRYFNRIEDESVIQIDIGNNKTIINFITTNKLLYTRSISIGMNQAHKAIMEYLKITYPETLRLMHALNLDLTSYENNVQRNHFTAQGLSKQKLKKIFDIIDEIIQNLVEQILLTFKAVRVDSGDIEYNRVLISGGGSNLSGIGTVISRELELPVVSLPFLDEYKEHAVISQFPIAFGTILAYINQRRGSINFLKGEFLPDIAQETRKIYYLAAGFVGLTVFVLIINFAISLFLTSRSNREYNLVLAERYQRYFHARPETDDPVYDATKLLRKEKKELQEINRFIPDEGSFLDLMKDIAVMFKSSDKPIEFVLNNMVFNERIIGIEGTATESSDIDNFKERLIKSKKFESVTLNIKFSRKNEVRFSLTIKQKLADSRKPTGGKQ